MWCDGSCASVTVMPTDSDLAAAAAASQQLVDEGPSVSSTASHATQARHSAHPAVGALTSNALSICPRENTTAPALRPPCNAPGARSVTSARKGLLSARRVIAAPLQPQQRAWVMQRTAEGTAEGTARWGWDAARASVRQRHQLLGAMLTRRCGFSIGAGRARCDAPDDLTATHLICSAASRPHRAGGARQSTNSNHRPSSDHCPSPEPASPAERRSIQPDSKPRASGIPAAQYLNLLFVPRDSATLRALLLPRGRLWRWCLADTARRWLRGHGARRRPESGRRNAQ